MKFFWKMLILSGIILPVLSCVEHRFVIKVYPGGNYDVTYTAHGDRTDLLNADFTSPFDSTWHIVSTLDVPDAETYDYAAEKWFAPEEAFPATFYTGDSLSMEAVLKHPITIEKRKWLLNKTYQFTGTLEGRGVADKYPRMAQVFDDENADGWMEQVATYILTETLHRADVGFNLQPVLQKQLDDWLAENITGQPDSLLLVHMDELKTSGLTLLKQPLEPRYHARMDSIFKQLKDEARITNDLADDEFEFRLLLPGELMDTNADTTYGDTMVWTVGLQKYIDDDFIMSAKSRVVYPFRYKLLLGLVLLGILAIAVIIWKSSRRKATA